MLEMIKYGLKTVFILVWYKTIHSYVIIFFAMTSTDNYIRLDSKITGNWYIIWIKFMFHYCKDLVYLFNNKNCLWVIKELNVNFQ